MFSDLYYPDPPNRLEIRDKHLVLHQRDSVRENAILSTKVTTLNAEHSRFADIDFPRLEYSGSIMHNCMLERVSLKGCRFSYYRLSHCDLVDCDLTSTRFMAGCKIISCTFRGCRIGEIRKTFGGVNPKQRLALNFSGAAEIEGIPVIPDLYAKVLRDLPEKEWYTGDEVTTTASRWVSYPSTPVVIGHAALALARPHLSAPTSRTPRISRRALMERAA